MVYKVPTSYTSTKAQTLKGVSYAKDAVISVATMRTFRNANMLISSGRIKPNIDPHQRRGPYRRRPTMVHVPLQTGPGL